MRRLVFVCLLLVLPLQWPWAAVAGSCCLDCACAVEQLATGGGGHAPADRADAARGADAAFDAAGSPCDGDCLQCPGPVPAVLIAASASHGPPIGELSDGRYARHLPDAIPNLPLRPPQA